MTDREPVVEELIADDWERIGRWLNEKLFSTQAEGMRDRYVAYCLAKARTLRAEAAQKVALDARCAEIDAGPRVRGAAAL